MSVVYLPIIFIKRNTQCFENVIVVFVTEQHTTMYDMNTISNIKMKTEK